MIKEKIKQSLLRVAMRLSISIRGYKTEEEKLAIVEKCIEHFISKQGEDWEDQLPSFCLHVLCEFFDKSLVVKAHQKIMEKRILKECA